MTVNVIYDNRVRFPGDGLIVGDEVPMKNGSPGIIYAKRRDGSREFFVIVPLESVSPEWLARMYSGEFMEG